jgi:hypothetical protein
MIANHQNIIAAKEEQSRLLCVVDMAKYAGCSIEEAQFIRHVQENDIQDRYSVTSDQIACWQFDSEFVASDGKKCSCSECRQNRKQMRTHLRLERS